MLSCSTRAGLSRYYGYVTETKKNSLCKIIFLFNDCNDQITKCKNEWEVVLFPPDAIKYSIFK